jgi:hypothetical protein
MYTLNLYCQECGSDEGTLTYSSLEELLEVYPLARKVTQTHYELGTLCAINYHEGRCI